MHVLLIPSWYPAHPGDMSGCFFREQALALHDRGMRVGVITPVFRSLTEWRAITKGGYGLQVEHDSGIETLRFHGVRAFSWNHVLNMAFWEHTGLRAFNRYRRLHGRPDVLHVHATIFGLAWAAAIHREYGIPFVVTEHSSQFQRISIRPPLLAYLIKEMALASRAFGVSSALAKVLTSQVPLPPGRRWDVMHNMVSSRFGSAAPRQVLRNDTRIPVLLNVAGLYPYKGHYHLLHAVRMALDTGADFHLRIGGSGPQEIRLKELAASLNLSDRLVFLGHCSREQVAREMAASDAFVLSSSYETFGVVAVEALLSGKPVLATRCGGPEDIVVPNQDGYLVEKDDTTALSAGLLQLVRTLHQFDPQDLRRRCIDRFSEDAFARRHAELYRDVVASCAPPTETTP